MTHKDKGNYPDAAIIRYRIIEGQEAPNATTVVMKETELYKEI